MKIYVFPADEFGCGYYRLIWPAEELARQGHDVEVVTPRQRGRMLQGKLQGTEMVSIQIPADANVMIFQRVTHRHLVQAIRLIRRRGVAVVVDVDDDLTCIHPANPAFTMLHPRNGNVDHSWENTLRACEAATMVTVSTPALVNRYGKRDNALVLHNMIPARYLDVPRNDSNVVGWAGSVHSHPNDLQIMGPSIAQHLQAGGSFKIVGSGLGAHEALGLSRTTELETTGLIELRHWPLAVASIGVGVAPLADSKFNASKSWLKMAEYAACGVPCVASPRAEYTRLHKMGVGQLAKTSSEWRARIRELTASADLRAELSGRGREVMSGLTIEGNAWRWLDVWHEAARRQQSMPFAALKK